MGPWRRRRWTFDEACRVVTALLGQDRTTVEGAHHRLAGAPLGTGARRTDALERIREVLVQV